MYGDSDLVVNQIKEEWNTRHPGLIPYKDYARRLLPLFNKVADAIATLASMYQVNTWNDIPRITVRRLDRPAHVFTTEEVEDEKPWYYDIQHFL